MGKTPQAHFFTKSPEKRCHAPPLQGNLLRFPSTGCLGPSKRMGATKWQPTTSSRRRCSVRTPCPKTKRFSLRARQIVDSTWPRSSRGRTGRVHCCKTSTRAVSTTLKAAGCSYSASPSSGKLCLFQGVGEKVPKMGRERGLLGECSAPMFRKAKQGGRSTSFANSLCDNRFELGGNGQEEQAQGNRRFQRRCHKRSCGTGPGRRRSREG